MTPNEQYLLKRIEELVAAKATAVASLHRALKQTQARIRVLEAEALAYAPKPIKEQTSKEQTSPVRRDVVKFEDGYVVFNSLLVTGWFPTEPQAQQYADHVGNMRFGKTSQIQPEKAVEVAKELHEFYYTHLCPLT